MKKQVKASGQPSPTFTRYQGVAMRAARKVPTRKMRLSQLIPGLEEVASVTMVSVGAVPFAIRARKPCFVTVPAGVGGFLDVRERAPEDTSGTAFCRPSSRTGSASNT